MYDPWNRLVTLVDTTSTITVQQNAYDARTFRTKRQDYTSGTVSETRHFYFTSDWQSIEERLGTSPDTAKAERQYVWGGRYVDDLVLRDRDTNGDGTLDERAYGLQDANWNVVAISDISATPRERYLYTSFGSPMYLDGSMSTVREASAIENVVLFTGQQLDESTSLHLFRHRWLSSVEGRFISRDPLNYPDGPSMYAAWFIPMSTDQSGLALPVIIIGGVLVVGCACIVKMGIADGANGATKMNAEQTSCFDKARADIKGVGGDAECPDRYYPPRVRTKYDGPKASFTWYSSICGSTIYWDPDDISCDSCDGYMNTIATVFHECDHAKGSVHPGTYCTEAKFLREKLLPNCKAGLGPCKSKEDCEKAVKKQLEAAQEACDSGNAGDV
jgi:RHS repeat-associated protein